MHEKAGGINIVCINALMGEFVMHNENKDHIIVVENWKNFHKR